MKSINLVFMCRYSSPESYDLFNEAIGQMAMELAPNFPLEHDARGQASDIYLFILDYSEAYKGHDFEADVTEAVFEMFSKRDSLYER